MPLKVWLVVLCLPFASAQSAKETLSYNIEWRLFTAGKAKVERNDGQINMHVESIGIVSKLFKVEDDYSVGLNAATCAQTVHSTTHEGSRQRETRITFDAETKKASYLERDRAKNTVVLSHEIDIPPCVHDVIGGLFFLPTLNLEPGQSAQVPVSDGKKSVMAKVEAQAREEVKTPAGTFKTVRYEVYLFGGVLYKRPAHLNVWLSDDRRRIPVQLRVRMTFTIGTITLQLEKHE